jgi:hypothetical protein
MTHLINDLPEDSSRSSCRRNFRFPASREVVGALLLHAAAADSVALRLPMAAAAPLSLAVSALPQQLNTCQVVCVPA